MYRVNVISYSDCTLILLYHAMFWSYKAGIPICPIIWWFDGSVGKSGNVSAQSSDCMRFWRIGWKRMEPNKSDLIRWITYDYLFLSLREMHYVINIIKSYAIGRVVGTKNQDGILANMIRIRLRLSTPMPSNSLKIEQWCAGFMQMFGAHKLPYFIITMSYNTLLLSFLHYLMHFSFEMFFVICWLFYSFKCVPSRDSNECRHHIVFFFYILCLKSHYSTKKIHLYAASLYVYVYLVIEYK